MKRTPKILIRCDGSKSKGMGHIIRSMEISRCLAEKAEIYFLTDTDKEVSKMLLDRGYNVLTLNKKEEDVEHYLIKTIKEKSIDALIVDLPPENRLSLVNTEKTGILIITIDDGTERRVSADLAFYPPVPQVDEMNWSGHKGTYYWGWEWTIVRKEITDSSAKYRWKDKKKNNSRAKRKVLITVGYSDPEKYGLSILEALCYSRIELDLEVIFISGPLCSYSMQLQEWTKVFGKDLRIEDSPKDIGKIMREADWAICTFGTTAYELAALEVPTLYLCRSEEDVKSANYLCKYRESDKCLGLYKEYRKKDLAKEINKYSLGQEKKAKTNTGAELLIDGLGAERISQKIMERWRARKIR